jgi:glyoxylase-like metal-dependent hydrolase (beta-lactamase superfamily II)
VLAYQGADDVDRQLRNGDHVWAGDRAFEVVHCPGHTSDSICLLDRHDGVLFAGDAPLRLAAEGSTYEEGFAAALERICASEVRTIYFGHGPPLRQGCGEVLRRSLDIARKGRKPLRGG